MQPDSDDDFRSGCRSPSQDYTHPDDHNLPTYEMTPEFKPFTVKKNNNKQTNEGLNCPCNNLPHVCTQGTNCPFLQEVPAIMTIPTCKQFGPEQATRMELYLFSNIAKLTLQGLSRTLAIYKKEYPLV